MSNSGSTQSTTQSTTQVINSQLTMLMKYTMSFQYSKKNPLASFLHCTGNTTLRKQALKTWQLMTTTWGRFVTIIIAQRKWKKNLNTTRVQHSTTTHTQCETSSLAIVFHKIKQKKIMISPTSYGFKETNGCCYWSEFKFIECILIIQSVQSCCIDSVCYSAAPPLTGTQKWPGASSF